MHSEKWIAERIGGDDDNPVYAVTSGYRYIADFLTEAEARLIAAAPMLLEALKAIADPTTRIDGKFAEFAIQRFQTIAREAIKAATFQTSQPEPSSVPQSSDPTLEPRASRGT